MQLTKIRGFVLSVFLALKNACRWRSECVMKVIQSTAYTKNRARDKGPFIHK